MLPNDFFWVIRDRVFKFANGSSASIFPVIKAFFKKKQWSLREVSNFVIPVIFTIVDLHGHEIREIAIFSYGKAKVCW